MSKINNLVGDRIRLLRNERNLSQDKLAERAGLHNTYIGQVERGEKNVTIESLEKIVNALGISFEELFKNIMPRKMMNSIPSDCYNIILKLPIKDQNYIIDIIEKIIEFKNTD